MKPTPTANFASKFVILSSARPNLSQEVLDERRESLAQDIEALGLHPVSALGMWEGTTEDSFVVECPTADDVTQLHKLSLKYEQDAILYVNNLNAYLLYPDGELVPVGTWAAVEPEEALTAIGYTLCLGQYYVTKDNVVEDFVLGTPTALQNTTEPSRTL